MGFLGYLWDFSKRVGSVAVKFGSVALATGVGYEIGSVGTLVIDSLSCAGRGIFTIEPSTFTQYFLSNASTILRHSNEVGGVVAAAMGVGAAITLYKTSRR